MSLGWEAGSEFETRQRDHRHILTAAAARTPACRRSGAGRVSRNQALSHCIKNQLGQIVQVQFLENIVAVRLHG